MTIKWFGHSCFLITDSKETKLLTDPFNDSIGYPPLNESPDIVTISHHHFDHDFIKNINCPKENMLDTCGQFNISGISIKGIPSFHDDVHGSKRGKNIIFIFKMDGLTLCHLGDLGYVLSKEDVQTLGNIDVLFIPIGGNYTLNSKNALTLIKLIKPHVTIPMHYKTPALKFPLDGVDSFLKYVNNVDKIYSNKLTLNTDIKFLNNQIKILNYK